jgi:hypothetical protein
MNLLLEVDANCTVRADDFIGTDARVGRDVPAGIGNPHVGGIITHGVMSAFDSSGNECAQKILFGECAR